MHFEQFVTARRAPPKRVVLHFDATDLPLCRMQKGRHCHGHYRAYCYLPLYVFAGRHLLEAVLRQSDPDAAHRAGAVLAGGFGCGPLLSLTRFREIRPLFETGVRHGLIAKQARIVVFPQCRVELTHLLFIGQGCRHTGARQRLKGALGQRRRR